MIREILNEIEFNPANKDAQIGEKKSITEFVLSLKELGLASLASALYFLVINIFTFRM